MRPTVASERSQCQAAGTVQDPARLGVSLYLRGMLRNFAAERKVEVCLSRSRGRQRGDASVALNRLPFFSTFEEQRVAQRT